jgi:hypothetical protein
MTKGTARRSLDQASSNESAAARDPTAKPNGIAAAAPTSHSCARRRNYPCARLPNGMRLGVLGTTEEIWHTRLFNDLALVHHSDRIGKMPD